MDRKKLSLGCGSGEQVGAEAAGGRDSGSRDSGRVGRQLPWLWLLHCVKTGGRAAATVCFLTALYSNPRWEAFPLC